VIAAAALGYVLWRLQLHDIRTHLTGMTWWMVVAAILLQIAPRLLEAARWGYLLDPIEIRYRHLLQSVYVGTLYSGVLPFSGGDVVRAVIVARRTRTGLARVLSTEFIERVADAFAIILVIWVTLRGFTLPLPLRIARIVLEVGVGVAIVGAVALGVWKKPLRRRLEGWSRDTRLARRMRKTVLEVIETAEMARVRTMSAAIGAGLAAMVANVFSYWLILHAYHILLSPLEAAAIFSIVMIGTFLPNTPGNVGSWQFFCVIGLQLFGVSSSVAAGYAIVAFFIWTIPPILMGVIALFSSPFSWSSLRGGQEVSLDQKADQPAECLVEQ
jgi:hypothetical protein